MVQSVSKLISDAEELEKLFRPDITGGEISDKLQMPTPESEGIVVRLKYLTTKEGKLAVVDQVQNPKFKGGIAEFMNVEVVGKEGIDKRLNLSESVKNALRRTMNDNQWKVVDLPGKVVQITANYWSNSPRDKRDANVKCVRCGGVGCKFCGFVGLQPGVVFNIHARNDLMSPTNAVTGKNDGRNEF
jgi:hypothetical protein